MDICVDRAKILPKQRLDQRMFQNHKKLSSVLDKQAFL